MSHISPAAIFSPSVARQQLAVQKDWNYIDVWLTSKLGGKAPPPFERNADTLKALLAMAAQNEAADEERELLARAQEQSLAQLKAQEEARSEQEGMYLQALEDTLPSEGKVALEALATMTVELGQSQFDVEQVAGRLMALQRTIFDLEQMADRADSLEKKLQAELAGLEILHQELESDVYRPAENLERETVDLQRKAKLLAARLSESQNRAGGSRARVKTTIQDVRTAEANHREMMETVRQLEAQVKSFHGLPQDTDLARLQLESLRVELRELVQERDALFEGLVERESPRRVR